MHLEFYPVSFWVSSYAGDWRKEHKKLDNLINDVDQGRSCFLFSYMKQMQLLLGLCKV